MLIIEFAIILSYMSICTKYKSRSPVKKTDYRQESLKLDEMLDVSSYPSNFELLSRLITILMLSKLAKNGFEKINENNIPLEY